MSDGNGDDDRGEAVLAVFQRGAQFARELLGENERLRGRLNELRERQQTAAQSPHDWGKLRYELINRIADLESENRDIAQQLLHVESENQQFAGRYVEIEEENNNLANLYVASYQLHSTLDPGEVMRIIVEIVINLIGAEIFCVYVCQEDSDILEPVASEGADLAVFPKHRIGQGPLGEVVESGSVVCSEGPARPDLPLEQQLPIVAIPLRVAELPVGAIGVYKLLQQKSGFSALDHELFTLLAGHAATSILASRLYAHSERKLSTINGFIELLTK